MSGKTVEKFAPYEKEGDEVVFGYAYDCGFIYGGFSFAAYASGATAYMPFQSPFARSNVLNGPTLPKEDAEAVAEAVSEIREDSETCGETRDRLVLDGGKSSFLLSGGGEILTFGRENFEESDSDPLSALFRLVAEKLAKVGMNVSSSKMEVPCRRIESFSLRTEAGTEILSERKGRVQTLTASRNGRASLTVLFEEGSDEQEIALDGKKTEVLFKGLADFLEGHEEIGSEAEKPKREESLAEPDPSEAGFWEMTAVYEDGSDETFFGTCSKTDERSRKFTEVLRKNTGLRKKLYGMTG